MKLPFAEQAAVPDRKIIRHLLDPNHPEGGSKAAYFLGLGYSPDRPERFRASLLSLGRSSEMEEMSTVFGPKYTGAGTVVAPTGAMIQVRTVWMLRGGSPPPTLITAYPD